MIALGLLFLLGTIGYCGWFFGRLHEAEAE